MSPVFQSEFLISLLLILITLRPFLHVHNQIKNGIALLSVFSIFMCIFQILSHGVSLSILILSALSVLIFIANLFYLLEYARGILVDYYSIFFRILSAILFLGVAASLYFSWTFRPQIEQFIDKKSVTKVHKSIEFFDSFAERYAVAEKNLFTLSKTIAYIVYPDNFTQQQLESLPICVYMPDVFASVEESFATIKNLADRGNIVLSVDFFNHDYADHTFFNNRFIRTFYLRMKNYFDKDFAKSNRNYWNQLKTKEIKSVFSLFPQIQNDVFKNALAKKNPILLVAEGENRNLIFDVINLLDYQVDNVLLVNEEKSPVSGYLDGFGNLAVYHPFEYTLYADIKTDGWTQAKIIASKLERLK
ncbi:MAG: hypothetical protein ACRC4W_06690 [Treponemataceae bacterium]